MTRLPYEEFLRAKVPQSERSGPGLSVDLVNGLLKPHQRDIVRWAVEGGRRAIFAAFGLGKTFMQLEVAGLIRQQTGVSFLIVAPLGVRQEFFRDAQKLGIEIAFIRSIEEIESKPTGIYITNYETVRDGKLDPRLFGGVSLDEAAVLRGFGGTKTFREFMRLFEGIRYKFVATATPSPNEFIELLAYSAFLEVMEVSEAKTRFFKRDSTKADHLTLHPHKEFEFWLWVSTWAIFVQRPSDLGYGDDGYDLPEIEVHWHEIPSDHTKAGHETSGQARLLKGAAMGVVDAAREKRDSLPARIEKLMELRSIDPPAHRLIWHDLEAERKAIEKAIPGIATVWGSQDLDKREQIIIDFSDGKIPELATKPVLCGSGCNFQRHCAWAIFLGIGFKFAEFIQAIHRVQRFLQARKVRIDLIYTEAERHVREVLESKWAQHQELVDQMTRIIRKVSLDRALGRSMGVERVGFSGADWRLVNNDCVLETRSMASDSVDLILTSIPFSTQYQYSPNYADLGHTDNNEHFWQQMDYLIPELLRVLKPGRLAAIHVKDRIVPGGLKGLGFQTVYYFHKDTIEHFEEAGFASLGMKTIVTDVVRENNQTYRLGWSEQCKDGTKMGFGLPEYLLLFRKPPTQTDRARGYANEPVVKDKREYTRSRWQIDSHGFARSSGDRLLAPEDLDGLQHEQIFKLFRRCCESDVYNHERHVALAEALEKCSECGHIHTGTKTCGTCPCDKAASRLPMTFMLLQPASWSDEVWSDVARMLSLNTLQSAKGRELHLCPLQRDICERAINQWSNPGDLVLDPFAGIGSVPYYAVLLGRRGLGIELNPRYCADAVSYLRSAEQKASTPTLFDLMEKPLEEHDGTPTAQ